MPHYFGCNINIHNTGESCEWAIEGCSVSLSFFFLQSFLLFFLFLIHVNVGNVLSVLIQKVQWIESKRNWEKTLINTAWPLTNQTRAYQQDLETTPETTLTCLRFEHRKRNREKTLINTGWSLNSHKCVYQRALQTTQGTENPLINTE